MKRDRGEEKEISGLMMGEWRIIPRVPRDVGGGSDFKLDGKIESWA